MFSSASVCLFVSRITLTIQPIFTKFGVKVAHVPLRKLLDFRSEPRYVNARLRALRGGGSAIHHTGVT